MILSNRALSLALYVTSPHRQAEFYADVFGMRTEDSARGVRVRFDGAVSFIEFRGASGGSYRHSPDDVYWKIAFGVPDVEAAAAYLSTALSTWELDVGVPFSVPDVAYLCHLQDPEGFHIELLQHTFQDGPKTRQVDPEHPFEHAALSLLTLRTRHMSAEAQRCEAADMRLLSVQPVAERGFTLHFFAPSDERPPNPDPEALENRPWLWQRPFTSLEFQHLERPGPPLRKRPHGTPGDFEILLGATPIVH